MFRSKINTRSIHQTRENYSKFVTDVKFFKIHCRSLKPFIQICFYQTFSLNSFHIHDFFFNLVLASKSINSRQELLFLMKPKTPASLLLEASSESRIFMNLMTQKIQAMSEKLVDKERKVTSLLGSSIKDVRMF